MTPQIFFGFGPKTSGAVLAGVIALCLASAASSQEVVKVIDGQPITSLDIEHRAKFLEMSKKRAPAQDEVLDTLTREILQITEAKRRGIEVSDSEVDKAYEDVASRMGIDGAKLTHLLVAGGASDDTFKRRLRAQIAWTKLIGAKANGSERSETK